ISLMPSNLYGPKDNYNLKNSHVLPALIRKFYEAKKNNLKTVTCWGTGKPLREFLHSDDLGEACVYVLEKWNPDGLNSPKDDFGKPLFYLNAGSGVDITIKDLAYLISETTGFKGEISWDSSKPDGTFKKLLNTSKIKSIGWEPKISLEEGIQNIVKNFPSFYEKKLIRL
ncbi:NAD-dependent epimerase/dehydratase family protein, partial [Prochlorococcus sp. AH-736-N17]